MWRNGPFLHWWWEYEWPHPSWKIICQYLLIFKTRVYTDPAEKFPKETYNPWRTLCAALLWEEEDWQWAVSHWKESMTSASIDLKDWPRCIIKCGGRGMGARIYREMSLITIQFYKKEVKESYIWIYVSVQDYMSSVWKGMYQTISTGCLREERGARRWHERK